MIRPKDAEAFCQAVDAEEKAREEAGERRATRADIEALMAPYGNRLLDYWGGELSPTEKALYRHYCDMLTWPEKDLPFLSDLVNEEE